MEKRVLISRWLGPGSQSIPIYDEASVSTARQRVRETGATFNASTSLVESVALIASELTHNQLAYSKQGYFAVRRIDREGVKGLEVLAADLGPGIGRPILQGTVSSEGGLGAGLGGVFRLADEVEVDTRRNEGVCVVARKFESPPPRTCEIALAGQPYPGEVISGDDGVYFHTGSGFLAAVCDGLGHGPEAREASNRAIEAIMHNRDLDIAKIVAAVNTEIAGTRGCALTIARFTWQTRTLECLSAGDIRAHLYHLRDAHFFTSTPFVVGDRDVSTRRLRVEEIPVKPGSVFVMFTDGLESRTTLKGHLDLLRRPAISIAQQLIETHVRGTDDALVLVARITN